MLERIKSKNILKKIFKQIDDGKKLKILHYNKRIKNQINISLINYKLYSGRYIIYDEIGKGKEYNSHNNQLIYEGEFRNGKRNGDGKEYNENKLLVFYGFYLNGQRWIGKGKEYDKRGELIFEGDYLNGRINGKGKEYNNGQLKFEGDYLNGKKNGKGKEFDKYGNLISEGEYLYNWKIKGKEYTNGKLEFEGEYFFEKRWNGIVYDKNGKVIYELIDGKGKVKELYKNGKIKLEIYFSTDLKIGNGKEYDENGLLKFEGE